MFPSCRTLLRFVISWIALLEISYLQGRPVNSTAKNFALFQHIEASSSCGLEGSEVFCLPGNDTVCETCDATCPSGRRLPFAFVDLVSEGTVHQVMKSLNCNYFNGSLFHCSTIDVINLRHHVTDTTHYFKG